MFEKIVAWFKRVFFVDKEIKWYKKTYYFKETGVPYEWAKEKGSWFEVECYETIREELGTDFPILSNMLIPRVDSVNEFSEIDLILFHNTGIYVLELKDYSGIVYGKLDDAYWTVYYTNDVEKDVEVEKVYTPLNPLIQNKKHVEDLKKIINTTYRDYVIFNRNNRIHSFIENVIFIDEFIKLVREQKMLSKEAYAEIEKFYHLIKEKDYGQDEAIKKLHILRQKINRAKYQK